MTSHSQQIGRTQPPQTLLQVVGYGVSGLGIAFAADARQQLEQLAELGLVYLDARQQADFAGLKFHINSNSPANDFLAGIPRNGFFRELFEHGSGQQLLDMQQQRTPLTRVADFFQQASLQLSRYLDQQENSDVMWQAPVAKLRVEQDGSFTSLDANGRPLARSRYAVLAAGGSEHPNPSVEAHANQFQCPLRMSEAVLRGHIDDELKACIAAGRQVLVVGGSHSAFSIADYLLNRFAPMLTVGQVVLATRSPVRVHYRDMPEFSANADAGAPCCIDFETRSINRFSGLRGDAKALYQDIVAGLEPKVQLLEALASQLSSGVAGSCCNNVGLVVQAAGYRSAFPPLVDHQHQPLDCRREQQLAALNGQYQVCCSQHQPIKGLFGIGLGGFVPEGIAYSTSREIPVGVNIYHQQDAAIVLDAIFDELRRTGGLPSAAAGGARSGSHSGRRKGLHDAPAAFEKGTC